MTNITITQINTASTVTAPSGSEILVLDDGVATKGMAASVMRDYVRANGGALNVPTATASRIAQIDASKNVQSLDTATYPSLTELAYLKGTTSALQTQLNAKQPLDADLTALAGLASAADRLPYFTGSGTASLATFTAAGRELVDDADAAAQRTTLGVDAAATYGTYTPTLVSTGATFTYLSQVGKYAIYGKYCYVIIQIVTTNATGTLTNGLNVVLPFATLSGAAGIYRNVGTTYATTDLIVSEQSASVNLFLGTNGSYGGVTPTTAGLAGATRYININLKYQITA